MIYALLLVFSVSVAQAVSWPIVKCQIEGTQNEYTTRGLKGSADCGPATQEAACAQYSSDPKLGPSKPIGCQLLTDPEQLTKAAAQAIMSRKNPQPPVSAAPKQAAPAGPQEKPKLPVITTCKVKNPAAVRKDYVTLVNNPECVQADMQKACDEYEKVPEYGPATATDCQKFTSLDDIKEFIKKESVQAGTGRFPGRGGKAVLCETRGNNPTKTKYKYAMPVPNCDDPATLAKACETHLGLADPIGCTSFFPDTQLFDYLNNKYPMLHGLECQLKKGGTAYRVDVPDCSDAVKNNRCKPKSGDVVGCKLFPNRKLEEEWRQIWANPAFITCRNQMAGQTIDIPNNLGRDCSPETQKKVCFLGTPIGCEMHDIEGLRKGQASIFKPLG